MQPDKKLLRNFITTALSEDVGEGDHTSLACIPAGSKGKAVLLAKEKGIIAGVELAKEICRIVDPAIKVDVLIADGMPIQPGDTVLTLEGSSHGILQAERLLLNCMQRMSGIATLTGRIAATLKQTNTRVLDTRKTTPGMRCLEKWAVTIGGGVNHRFGLYDMILIKDNHIDYAGGIPNAIQAANNYLNKTGKKLEIEIEARNLGEVREILATGGVNRIMLDNFSFSDLKSALKLINGRFATEASGGITEETAAEYARCGVDYISIGALTHSVKSIDLSLKAIP